MTRTRVGRDLVWLLRADGFRTPEAADDLGEAGAGVGGFGLGQLLGIAYNRSMLSFRFLPALVAVLLVATSTFAAPASGQRRPGPSKAILSSEVKKEARKLVDAWLGTAGANTLDGLANRTIAFAGLVPGLDVTLDGKQMSAGDALIASALTIIKSHSNDEDARAIRNAVYALMEISQGRVKASKRR